MRSLAGLAPIHPPPFLPPSARLLHSEGFSNILREPQNPGMPMSERVLETDVRASEQIEARSGTSPTRNTLMLFLASFLALYFELVVIRYLSTEIRVFAYLKNLTLIASFFGIGLGMILGQTPKALKRLFPLVTAALFLLIAFAPVLRLTHLPVPGNQYEMFGHAPALSGGWAVLWFFLGPWVFFAIVPAILYVVV